MKDTPWLDEWTKAKPKHFANIGGPYRNDHMFKKHGNLQTMYKGDPPIYYQARIIKFK